VLFILLPTNACQTQNSLPQASTTPTHITQSTTNTIGAIATNYYNAIEKQDYPLAYTYLDAAATKFSQSSFMQEARSRDQEEGKVQSYSTAAFPPMVIMTVTRVNLGPYHVHLQFKQENTRWKIVELERI